VTRDHSLFSLDVDDLIKEVKPTDLKEGNFIAIPRKLEFGETRDFLIVYLFWVS